MAKCGACGKFLSTTDGVRCSKCTSLYHLGCAGLSDGGQLRKSWMCSTCNKEHSKLKKNETPLRGHSTDVPSDNRTSTPLENILPQNRSAPAAEEGPDLAVEIKLFREELRATRSEIQELRREISNMSSSIRLCNERMDHLETRVDTLEKCVEERNGCDCGSLENTITQLKLELIDRDQQLLANDVDIAGIPESKGEGLAHVVLSIAKKLGVAMEERDIVSAERVGPVRGFVEGEPSPRPRTIAVRLVRRVIRDDLLRQARVRRGATTADLGVSGSARPFYVNERLSRMNRYLFMKARETGARLNFKYVWSRDGKIYVRKDDGKIKQRLRSENDFGRVFGTFVSGSPKS